MEYTQKPHPGSDKDQLKLSKRLIQALYVEQMSWLSFIRLDAVHQLQRSQGGVL